MWQEAEQCLVEGEFSYYPKGGSRNYLNYLNKKRVHLCQHAREPWHTPFPFSARTAGLPPGAVPSSICCCRLRLIPKPYSCLGLVSSQRSCSSAFQKEQGQEFRQNNLHADLSLTGRPASKSKGCSCLVKTPRHMRVERAFL